MEFWKCELKRRKFVEIENIFKIFNKKKKENIFKIWKYSEGEVFS